MPVAKKKVSKVSNVTKKVALRKAVAKVRKAGVVVKAETTAAKKTIKKVDRRLTALQTERLSAVEQIKNAFASHQRMSAVLGFMLGGFIPVATYIVVHYEVAVSPALWVLVVGGLLYSAITVFKWSKQAFNMTAKAYGFVVLLEGVVTFASSHTLALCGLAILVAINGIGATVALQARPQQA